jgi:hypothetical protein
LLIEFTQYDEREPRTMERVTQTIHHLIRHQFIHIGDRGAAPLLETLRRAAAAKLIADYFDVAGYRLVTRESEGWAGILPDPDRVPAPRMTVNETIVLLILARLWQQGIQEGVIGDHATVLLTLNEAYDAYQDLVSRSRRAAMRIEEFRENVKELGRRAIVRLESYDEELQDQELSIRPIVMILAGDDFLSTIENLIRQHVASEAAAASADAASAAEE